MKMDLADTLIPAFQNTNEIILLWQQDKTFIDSSVYCLKIIGKQSVVEVTVEPGDIDELFFQISALVDMFSPIIITYDSKDMFSSFRYHLICSGWKSDLKFSSKIIDLRYLELFAGVDLPVPQNLSETLRRLKLVLGGIKINNDIHVPLATRVLPAIETTPILRSNGAKYSRYLIEGTTTGRLTCNRPNERFYMPHGLDDKVKFDIRPVGENKKFVLFDFSGMEVKVLNFITKDPKLDEAFKSGDPYLGIYKLISSSENMSSNFRDSIKRTFLPVMYGMTHYGISKEFNCTDEFSEGLIQEYYNTFKISIDYLDQAELQATQQGVVVDVVGRRRNYLEEPRKARGAQIQSPAAIVCMEKLIELYDGINGIGEVVMSVHDGYVLVCDEGKVDSLIKQGKDILTSPSKILSGLKLDVKIKTGPNLGRMEFYDRA